MAGEDKPILTIIAGPNGAGKSTIVNAMQADGYDFGPLVNPDIIAAELPAGTPNSLTKAGRLALRQIDTHIAERRSFAQETTLTSAQPVRLIERAKKAGYHVNVLYVGIQALSLSSRRVAGRVAQGGHNVPLADQKRRFDRSRQKTSNLRPSRPKGSRKAPETPEDPSHRSLTRRSPMPLNE